MSEAPTRVYLQFEKALPTQEGVTWCEDKIFDSDVEYVRRDIFEEKFDRIKKLENE